MIPSSHEGGEAKVGMQKGRDAGQGGHSQLRGGDEIGGGTFKSRLDEMEQSEQKAGGAGKALADSGGAGASGREGGTEMAIG